jgi:hypothetical protein
LPGAVPGGTLGVRRGGDTPPMALVPWMRSHRVEVKYALIALVLGGGAVWLERSGVLGDWAAALDPVIERLASLGLAGAFLLGLLGNSSLLLQVPYTIPLLSAALAGASLPYLVGLGVAAGLGATLGELVSYTIADLILRRQDLAPSRLFRWVQRTVATHPRAIPVLVFGFAVTMLPDDAVLIPLAMIGYGAGRLLLPLLLGKLGYCVGSAVLFFFIGERAAQQVSASATADLALVVIVGFVVLVLYQAEAARARRRRADSVEVPTPRRSDGTQGPDRARGGLRRGHADRGRGGGHEAHRRA